jgi:hypothetical protein
MTIRDPEVLEALSEQPELLAIADAVAETQRLPRRPHRRAFARAAGIVALGAAVLITALLWPSGGKRNPILDRALAAIGDGPVLHLVVRVPTGQELVNLDTGETIAPAMEFESWSDRSLERFHFVIRENGRVVGEVLLPQDRTKDTRVFANDDAAYAALWSGYRDALRSGKAKIVREGTVDGRPVYWLSFESPRNEVAVDRRTYRPIVFRSISAGGRHTDTRVLLMRTEPFSSSDFERRTSAPNPLTGESHGSGVQVAPVAPSKPAKPWLTAGPSIAGLSRTAVHQTQTTSDSGTSNGFELVYGPEDDFGAKSLTIDETKRPDEPSEWKGIPKGFVRLSVGEGSAGNSEGNQKQYTVWTGSLVLNGVYVTITTGVSRAALLEAARALRPA